MWGQYHESYHIMSWVNHYISSIIVLILHDHHVNQHKTCFSVCGTMNRLSWWMCAEWSWSSACRDCVTLSRVWARKYHPLQIYTHRNLIRAFINVYMRAEHHTSFMTVHLSNKNNKHMSLVLYLTQILSWVKRNCSQRTYTDIQ